MPHPLSNRLGRARLVVPCGAQLADLDMRQAECVPAKGRSKRLVPCEARGLYRLYSQEILRKPGTVHLLQTLAIAINVASA